MATTVKLDKIIVTQDATADDQESTICRQNPYPLDTTEIFYDKNIAELYASDGVTGNKFQNSATCYVGQKITVVDKTNGRQQTYVVKNTTGNLSNIIDTDNITDYIVSSFNNMTQDEKNTVIEALDIHKDTNCLKFKCLDNTGLITLSMSGSPDPINLVYKKNNGSWTNYTVGETISLVKNDTVQFKSNGSTTFSNGINYYYFVIPYKTECSGNIMYLIDPTGQSKVIPTYFCFYRLFKDCTSLTTAPELPATTLANGCYSGMFDGCKNLKTIPELPATTLSSHCYDGMFYDCTSLITAPELPATTLAVDCYNGMFSGCTSLTTAPELPATTLAEKCYDYMFNRCTSLTTAPELPATTLASNCYYAMFSGCTSLTTAPELPATTLADMCYYAMFLNCTSLNSVTASFTNWNESTECTTNWLENVSSTGTFYCPSSLDTTTRDGSHIPVGWNVAGSITLKNIRQKIDEITDTYVIEHDPVSSEYGKTYWELVDRNHVNTYPVEFTGDKWYTNYKYYYKDNNENFVEINTTTYTTPNNAKLTFSVDKLYCKSLKNITLQMKNLLSNANGSKYEKQFDTKDQIPWKNSSIRTWLNNDFCTNILGNYSSICSNVLLETYTSDTTKEILIDKVWLASITELGNGSPLVIGAEGTILDKYNVTPVDDVRVKNSNDGTRGVWWTRSLTQGNANSSVGPTGGIMIYPASFNNSISSLITITPSGQIENLSNCSNIDLQITKNTTTNKWHASIRWTDPQNKYNNNGDPTAEWYGTVLTRKEGSSPTGPTDGVVITETNRNTYKVTPYEDTTDLNEGSTYYYKLFPYTERVGEGRVYIDSPENCVNKFAGYILSFDNITEIDVESGDTVISPVLTSLGINEIIWEVVDQNHVPTCDENLTHTVTLQAKNVLSNLDGSGYEIIFDATTNIWQSSSIQNWLNTSFLNSLTSSVSCSRLQSVSNLTYNSLTTSSPVTSKIWLPSVYEVGGGKPNNVGQEGFILDKYNVDTHTPSTAEWDVRIKKSISNVDCNWLLRTANFNSTQKQIYYIYNGGYISNDGSVSQTRSIAPLITLGTTTHFKSINYTIDGSTITVLDPVSDYQIHYGLTNSPYKLYEFGTNKPTITDVGEGTHTVYFRITAKGYDIVHGSYEMIVHKVSFDTNGGTEVSPSLVLNGDKVEKQNSIREGFHFYKWYKDDSLIEEYNFNDPVTSSFTLYARWSDIDWTDTQFLKNMNIGDEVLGPSANGFGDIIWEMVDRDHVGVEGVDHVNTHTATLQAKNVLSNIDGSGYIKQFDTESKLWANSSIRSWLNSDLLTAFTTGKTGDEKIQSEAFVNGIKSTIITTYTSQSNLETTSDKVWLASVSQVGGGTPEGCYGSEGTILDKYNDASHTPSTDVWDIRQKKDNDNIDALCWWLRSTGSKTNYYVWSVAPRGVLNGILTENVCVSPLITFVYNNPSHKVTFVTNGGTDVADQMVENNRRVTIPTTSKVGYILDGWYTDSELTSLYDFNTPVTDELTLYAKWSTDSNYPLTFKCKTSSGFVKLTKIGTPDDISLVYSKNNGSWTPYTVDTQIDLVLNDTIQFKSNGSTTFSKDYNNYYNFVIPNKTECFGNIMYLIDPTGQSREITTDYCFYKLFYDCKITTASELPATTLTKQCYHSMFYHCESLTTPPELPATTLADLCYFNMFGYTTITTPPELPATTLAESCYQEMFFHSSLTTAPELPATTLAVDCYNGMFSGCTSLTTAPELPATTLASNCYKGMFNGCTSLNSVTASFTNWKESGYSTSNWLENVSSTGTFTCPSSLDTTTRDASHIPVGWNVVKPTEPLTFKCKTTTGSVKLTKSGTPDDISLVYSKNNGSWTPYTVDTQIDLVNNDTVQFKSNGSTTFSKKGGNYYYFVIPNSTQCSGNIMYLIDPTGQSKEITTDYCFIYLFSRNCKITTAPELPATKLKPYCYCCMFHSCILKTAPELPATTVTNNCYNSMFSGCTSLITPPELPATTLDEYCYYNMFSGCTSLTTAPILSCRVLENSCYKCMFMNCTLLTTAPELPATNDNLKDKESCYEQMFYGCSSLTSIRVSFTNWYVTNGMTSLWVSGVPESNSCKFYASSSLPDSRGSSAIPNKWNKIDPTTGY